MYAHNTEPDILSQLAASSDAISRLSSTDVDLFRAAFQSEPTYYCASWLYILRSTRDEQGSFGYKFVGKDALIGIGYRHHTVYLVHPMGKNRCAATIALCQQILHSMSCTIILKKIDQELYTSLTAAGLFSEQDTASIQQAETFSKYHTPAMLLEEETFAEHTLDLENLYNSVTGVYNQSGSFIRKVKRFEKNTLRLLPRNDLIHIENMSGFATLFASHPEKYYSYIQIIREVGTCGEKKGTYKISAYYDEYETVHGLYISETLKDGNMGLYCAVSSRDFPGITEWMDHDFFRRLYQDNIRYLYLGGSETKGVDDYIKKLFPMIPPYLLQPLRIDNPVGQLLEYASSVHIKLADA